MSTDSGPLPQVTKCDSLGSLLEAMDSHVTAPELRADTDCINQALGRRNQQVRAPPPS